MATNSVPQSACAVSVVIPMYNVEKYITETLGSILVQTFQDYEVIIVNDCSTDNSRQIAESYLEKFGGRLKIYDNEKNSGVSVTRNNGLRRAVGEYIIFMDSDDMLAPNALQYTHSLSKRFNADVVNFTSRCNMSEDGKELTFLEETKPLVPKNTIMIEENLTWRVQSLLKTRFTWSIWRRIFRREFLIKNQLFFPEDVRFAEDQTWMYGVFFCAKRVVHLPDAFYYYRFSEGSLCRGKSDIYRRVNRWLCPLTGNGIKWVNDVMNRLRFFQENYKLQHVILESFTGRYFSKIFKRSQKLQQRDIYKAVMQEFGDSLGEHDVLIAELITFVNTQQKKIAKLEEQLKAK